ncbi:MAG: hypothetical protein KDK90_28715 [Leptospiraceae bacterium]|nr:hypothetical protein [Leptospiraceae bacterium]
MKTKILIMTILLSFNSSIYSENYPDEETIKGDLIGKKVSSKEGNWNFDSLSEFKGFSIIDTIKAKNIVEYKIQLILQDMNSSDIYDATIHVSYKKVNEKWTFINVNLLKYKNLSKKDSPTKNQSSTPQPPSDPVLKCYCSYQCADGSYAENLVLGQEKSSSCDASCQEVCNSTADEKCSNSAAYDYLKTGKLDIDKFRFSWKAMCQ